MNDFTWTVAHIREVEKALLSRQSRPDELMQSAARAVAGAATELLLDDARPRPCVLILAGPGGNGGDGLYAGALLAQAGYPVDAYLTAGKAHPAALEALTGAGGAVLGGPPERIWEYRLVIDAITGIGGRAGLDEGLRDVVEDLDFPGVAALSVDVPSGVDADTGEGGDLHVTADATVTFGGWRRAHALSDACGDQLLADINVGDAGLAAEFERMSEEAELGGELTLFAYRGVPASGWPGGFDVLEPMDADPVAPGPADDKYSGGVVGIRAGSEDYPGAAILCATGAVNATPSMVRYVGPQALEVVRALPEVVAKQKLTDAGRVQAWVFGPGAGTGDAAARELRWVLEQEVPALIDADGLTLLATHPELRELAARREQPTVLTPHDGEFARLREAAGLPEQGRLEETLALAGALCCVVVRKGRHTLICPPAAGGAAGGADYAFAIDAGTSWAATPGSGDVLAGIIGARMARAAASEDTPEMLGLSVAEAAAEAVSIHAVAAQLAAETPYGEATAPASRIAAFVRDATAALSRA